MECETGRHSELKFPQFYPYHHVSGGTVNVTENSMFVTSREDNSTQREMFWAEPVPLDQRYADVLVILVAVHYSATKDTRQVKA